MRDQLLRGFESFTTSSVEARSGRIARVLDEQSTEEQQRLSPNPNFASAESANAGLLRAPPGRRSSPEVQPHEAGATTTDRYS